MKLLVRYPAGTEMQRASALEAALAVFLRTCVDPLDAFEAAFDEEGWELKGFPEDSALADEKDKAIAALRAAEAAARRELGLPDGDSDLTLEYDLTSLPGRHRGASKCGSGGKGSGSRWSGGTSGKRALRRNQGHRGR